MMVGLAAIIAVAFIVIVDIVNLIFPRIFQ